MASFGKISVRDTNDPNANPEHMMILTFNRRSAWFETERYIRQNRKDLTIVDSFWGYALYDNETDAIKAMEHFLRKPKTET